MQHSMQGLGTGRGRDMRGNAALPLYITLPTQGSPHKQTAGAFALLPLAQLNSRPLSVRVSESRQITCIK